MSITGRDHHDRARLIRAGFLDRFIQAGERFVAGHREGIVVAWALCAFFVLWMLYDTISLATVDVRWDASEAALWAQNFALGYKHPPLTAWLTALWFAVFPRTDWAAHLQDIAVIIIALAVTWRLLRDHLGKDRALFGLIALFLVPLYTFKTAELNANTVVMPCWAAALLFYLRARRGLGIMDAVLAGAFAGLTFLGKYWAIYLIVAMAVASLVGAGTRRFWRSPAPYLMAAAAAIVIAPHLYWFVSERGAANYAFIRDGVMSKDSLDAAAYRSMYYLLGASAYAAVPVLLLVLLRPSRAALVDTAWPPAEARQQVIILFAVPLLLPALVNLVLPHRLTPDWTYPNWALLPVALYASSYIAIDGSAVAKAGVTALAISLAFVIASPFIAYERLFVGLDHNRPRSREVAEVAERLTDKPVKFFWGSPVITGGLPFYRANSRPLDVEPLSAAGRFEIDAEGLLIACLDDDAPCRATQAALSGAGFTADVAIARIFLGFSGPSINIHVTVVPAERPRGAAIYEPNALSPR
jgi:hypothetical protein